MSGVVRLLWKKMPKSNKQGETSSFSQWRPHYPVYHSRMLFVMPPPGNTSKTNNHQCLPTKLEQCLLVWIPSTSHSVPPLTPHTHIFVGPSCSFGTVSKTYWVTDVHYYLSSSSSAASLDVNHPILAWTLKLPLTTESAKRSHYWNVDT